jgi:hypothetical protein
MTRGGSPVLGGAVLALVLLGTSPVRAAPDLFGAAGQNAFAIWAVEKGDTTTVFAAFAGVEAYYFSPSYADAGWLAGVGKSTCQRPSTHHGKESACLVVITIQKVEPGYVWIDPLLESGRMTLRTKRFTHTVTWGARGGPNGYFGENPDPSSAGIDAGFVRPAAAHGKLFGVSLRRKGLQQGFLLEGASGTGCVCGEDLSAGTRLKLWVELPAGRSG